MNITKSVKSTDEDLITLAKHGDKEAFSNLVLEIYNDLYSVAKLNLDEEDDIQDVLQETFIRAYLCLPKLKHNNFFKTWITKILLNECNKIHNLKKHNTQLMNKYVSNFDVHSSTNIDTKLDLEEMKNLLTDSENKIFSLYYEEGYTIKQISKKLNINQNTIKTKLRSARTKIKHSYKSVVATILIVIFITTGVVFGQDIISFIKDIFNLNTIGINNDNILDAIETKDWVQNVDMDYIDINEDYSIKISYMLIDDINLYIVFDLHSNIDLGTHNRISLTDLRIETDSGELITDEGEYINNGYSLSTAWKNVEATSNNIRELVYFISNGYPDMKSLKIHFSKIVLYTSSHDINAYTITLPEEITFNIDLEDKFINKSSVQYSISNPNDTSSFSVEKALYSDTGFYAIVKSKENTDFIIEDNGSIQHKASKRLLNLYDSDNNFYFLIFANISIENNYSAIIKSKKDKSQSLELTMIK